MNTQNKEKVKKGKIHLVEWVAGKPYYRCIRAVGSLSGQQIILRTQGMKYKRLTCKNCLRYAEKMKK